ncbi:LGFP repeat-containing protein [Promicromonospora sp. AC04]|uniref:CHAP domain-containing protein n=1 Tax=Promicromonospora sp. AC04 TaxID=2135723 RepID=UPI000D3848D8|nr:CHAP domain-containing protein [Promicromonospora sp. AC04]PUB20158.1 LGFP repeat-containing protein [Promicromonospora sp. AC04]
MERPLARQSRPASSRARSGVRHPRRGAGVLLAVALLLPASVVATGTVAEATAAPAAAGTVSTAAGTVSTAQGSVATAARQSALTAGVVERRLRKGETFWMFGRLTVGGSPARGRTVVVQKKRMDERGWRTVGTDTTNRAGRYSVRIRAGAVYEYRAIYRGSTTARASWTGRIGVGLTTTDRSMASRDRQMGVAIGRPTSGHRQVTRSVISRSYQHGILVKVTRSGRDRTWWVHGGILGEYRERGGARGRLGAPVMDPLCGLDRGGCVQRFEGGVLYTNADGAEASTGLKGVLGEVVATARSQVGYAVRYDGGNGSRYDWYSKYNVWARSNAPWCGLFQSWIFKGSGHSTLVPQSTTWGAYRDAVRRTRPTGSTPRVGALAFVSYIASGEASHTMFVVQVDGSRIKVIDGNTGGGGMLPSGVRGVVEHWVAESQVLYYAYPRY